MIAREKIEKAIKFQGCDVWNNITPAQVPKVIRGSIVYPGRIKHVPMDDNGE